MGGTGYDSLSGAQREEMLGCMKAIYALTLAMMDEVGPPRDAQAAAKAIRWDEGEVGPLPWGSRSQSGARHEAPGTRQVEERLRGLPLAELHAHDGSGETRAFCHCTSPVLVCMENPYIKINDSDE